MPATAVVMSICLSGACVEQPLPLGVLPVERSVTVPESDGHSVFVRVTDPDDSEAVLYSVELRDANGTAISSPKVTSLPTEEARVEVKMDGKPDLVVTIAPKS